VLGGVSGGVLGALFAEAKVGQIRPLTRRLGYEGRSQLVNLLALWQMGPVPLERVRFDGLLVTDPAVDAPRPTDDIDTIIEVATLGQYHEFQVELRKLGFKKDICDGAPIVGTHTTR